MARGKAFFIDNGVTQIPTDLEPGDTIKIYPSENLVRFCRNGSPLYPRNRGDSKILIYMGNIRAKEIARLIGITHGMSVRSLKSPHPDFELYEFYC